MKNIFLSTIPFEGFYESIHSIIRDSYLECLCCEWEQSDVDSLYDMYGIEGSFREDYAKEFAESWFASKYDLDGISFESLESPDFYNFTTDRIFVNITRGCLKDIICRTDKNIFKTLCETRFTNRDVFFSFYNQDYKTWGKLSEWDHNQIGAIVEAFCYTEQQKNPESDYLDEESLYEFEFFEYFDKETQAFINKVESNRDIK